ncbi:MAG: hypothetical protein IKS39_03255, partial [Clostridia bacterium]|nr:hypothetical protein [Clostridia bacterium]
GNTADILYCEPGDEISADVFFTSGFPVKSMAFLLQYNSSLLELNTDESELSGNMFILDVNTPDLGSGTYKNGNGLIPSAISHDNLDTVIVRFTATRFLIYDNANAFSLRFRIKDTAGDDESTELVVMPGTTMNPKNKYYPTEVTYVTNADLIGGTSANPGEYLTASQYLLTVNSESNTVTTADEPLPPTHTVTFIADGTTVGTAEFTEGDTSVSEPAVPGKAGYTGAWPAYTLGESDLTVTAEYTPVTYTATFIADGRVIAAEHFTVENTNINVPAVPAKLDYAGRWAPYTLGAADVTINAIYDYVNPTANSSLVVRTSADVDYRTKVRVTAKGENVPDRFRVALYDGDNLIAAGDSNYAAFDCGEMRGSRDYNARIIDADGNTMKNAAGAELRANISIRVNAGFFKKIIAFFKWLFRCLPSVTVGP